MRLMEVKLGMWRITSTWGCEYLVDVTEISDYRGGAISGKYWVDGDEYGDGCFPLCEIKKMEKTS